MTSIRRVKNIDAEDDDFVDDAGVDDYAEFAYADDGNAGGDDEDMTPEEKEQLRMGSFAVRQDLDSGEDGGYISGFVTDQEIQEAIWYYYFDVQKAVAYLRKKHTPKEAQKPSPKKTKQKATSRFDMAAQAAAEKTKSTNDIKGPSPDDVVANAQQQTKQTPAKPTAKRTNTSTSANGVADGVSALKLSDTLKDKSKNLDVIAEWQKSQLKKAANFAVIGHVDHGKSTLMGRILHDLELVGARTFNKLRAEATQSGKGSFSFAWLMDSTAEERQRGVTVDVATRSFETPTTRFTILDAPGHQDFVPNMIAGTAQADFAVLVVDASTNAFEAGLNGGQTKEHALLARSMGISRLVVAVNKLDAAGWSRARFDDIVQQTGAFLAAAGFRPENIAFVPCAGLTGENVVSRPANPHPLNEWYPSNAPTLLDALESSTSVAALTLLEKPLRFTVSDSFRPSLSASSAAGTAAIGSAVSLTGRVDAGTLQRGQPVLCMPSSTTGTIKSISSTDDAQSLLDWAVAGQIVTLHLSDLASPSASTSEEAAAGIRAGDALCDPRRDPLKNVTALSAKILAFGHLIPGEGVDVHKGRLHVGGRVGALEGILRKAKEKDGEKGGEDGMILEKRRPRVVKPGQVARVRIEVVQRGESGVGGGGGGGESDEDAAGAGAKKKGAAAKKGVAGVAVGLPLEVGARVVLRSEGETLAAGLVEAVFV